MNPWVSLVAFLGAGLLSLVVVHGSIFVAHHFKFVDNPDGERKTQERPIPKLGGVALALAFSSIVLLIFLIFGRSGDFFLALSVVLPALGLAAVGFFDDRANLNPYLRLLLQAAFALLAWILGSQIVVTGVPILDVLGFVIWVMVIVNGVNLLDNSDGLAASTVLVSAVGAAIIAGLFGQELVSLMALALAGTCAGFLGLNWFPARVYMGDAGAYFLGFLLAILTVRLRPEGLPSSLGIAIAVLLVLLPLIDTVYVVTKRMASGVHPFTAGRDHLSHIIQDNGRSVPGSVLLLQVISIVGVSGAVAIAVIAV
jgi:UDP-GlcNAc:undecaprenyl-phosphate GlcNAc-1-phosphate transferase